LVRRKKKVKMQIIINLWEAFFKAMDLITTNV